MWRLKRGGMTRVQLVANGTKLGWAVDTESCSDPFCSRVWCNPSVVFGWGDCVAQHLLMRRRKISTGSVTVTSTYTCTHFSQVLFKRIQTQIWFQFGQTGRWRLTYLVSEFNAGGATVGLGVRLVSVQHHLYPCIEFIHTHHRLTVGHQGRDKVTEHSLKH